LLILSLLCGGLSTRSSILNRSLLLLASIAAVAAVLSSGFGLGLGTDELLDDIECTIRGSGLRNKNLARFVNDENSASGTARSLLQTNSRDEGGVGITEERVLELLLLLETGVALGRVVGEAVEGEAGRSDIGIGISKIAYLSCA
jgi:hypothetical protein